MSLKLVATFFIYYFFTSFSVHPQGTVELLCRVIDAEAKSPVPYATIQFDDSNKGMVANIDGDFRILFSYKQKYKNIIISSIGYKTLTVLLDDLENKKINNIELQPKVEALDVVVLNSSKNTNTKNSVSAYTIVKTAIAKISENYPKDNYSKLGYYRDYQIVEGRYYNLNEAILESFDSGFHTDIIMYPDNQNVLYSYKENNDFLRDSLLLVPYDGDQKYINNTTLSGQGGNELGILNIHNPIRNYEQLSFSFIYIFEKKFLDNHDLTNLKKVYLNDEILYQISFKAKEKLTKASHKATGKIFISKADFSIHKLTYAVYEIPAAQLLFEVNIEYKKRDKFMYLNYITFNNQFVINGAFKFDVSEIKYDSNEKAFYLKFNSDLKEKSVNKKDFKFRFNKKKLLVDSFELIDLRTIKVSIADWSLPKELLVENKNTEPSEIQVRDSKTIDVNQPDGALDTIDASLFEYRIKNIYDRTNREIFKSPKTIGYQFREFFVQEIFKNKQSSNSMVFINKYQPLSEAKENKSPISDSYWLNSPLKGSEN